MTRRGPSPVVAITGASAGLGRAVVREFASAGYDVALLARGDAGLSGAAADVERHGGRALALPTDVAHHDEVAAAARRVERELGPIDVWVNNAMTTTFAPSWDVEPDDFVRAMEVTFLGQVWGTLAALEHMRPRDRGTIVSIGSALAFLGIPLQSAYCSGKFACRGFFESVRAELLHEGSHVRMSMVHMPAVNTTQFGWCENGMARRPKPVPPIYEPETVAPFVLRAAQDGRRERVVGSWNRLVVEAARSMPGLANRYAAAGAWESQLTDEPDDGDRPANLRRPLDERTDVGDRGPFDDEAGGFLDPKFLVTLPSAIATFGRAAGGLAGEKLDRLREPDGVRSRRVLAAAAVAAGLAAAVRLGSAAN